MENNIRQLDLRKIPIWDKIGYGSGNLGVGIGLQIIGTYLVFYATAVLDIPGSLIGFAVSVSVILDGFVDPIMGYISDITQLKGLGRRHLYLIIGCIGIAVSNYLLWIIDVKLPTMVKFAWIFVDVLVIRIFLTIFTTPYTALGAELSFDYNERTSIQGIKTIFFLLGLSFASVAGMVLFFKPTPEFPTGQLNPAAYSHMGFYSSILILIFGLICYFSTKKYIPSLPKWHPDECDKVGAARLIFNLREALNNRNYRYVVMGYMFTNIASALLGTIGLHVLTYTFSLNNNNIAYIIGAQFVVSIISQPFWVFVSKKTDKMPAVMLALTISIIGSFLFLLLVFFKEIAINSFYYFIPFAALMGLGTGGLYALPLSMIADTIDVEELHAGIRSEGTYYGCMTLLYKVSQSLAIFFLGILLDLVRFDSSRPVQPEGTVVVLGLILGVGMIIGFGFAALFYSKYDLDKNKVSAIQAAIKAKLLEKNQPNKCTGGQSFETP